MSTKITAQKSLALMVMSMSFALSLLISPATNGGIILKWHSGVLVNFALAVMYIIVIGREARFRGWSFLGSTLVLTGTFLGVFAIANIILINPFDGYGLFTAFLAEILIIINFRNLFMPFHQKGRLLILNLMMVILLCAIFKLSIMILPVPFLKIDSLMFGYLNLPIMASIWLASISAAFLGLFLMKHSISKENQYQLEIFKSKLGIDNKHLLLLKITNEELIGLNLHEIEDKIQIHLRRIIEASTHVKDLQKIAENIHNPENSWIAPIVNFSYQ
jgi:hypothetical protein